MFENRNQRTFYSAPQSVTSFVAAVLEPFLTVASFIAVTLAYDEPILRSTLTLCLLVFALTFPGRNRFRDSGIGFDNRFVGRHRSSLQERRRGVRPLASNRTNSAAAGRELFSSHWT